MNNRRLSLLIVILVSLSSVATGASYASKAVPALAAVKPGDPDTQFFPETGHGIEGRFLAYWQEHGGLAQQGYPISDETEEVSTIDGKTYTMQYFERSIFEYHPEKQAPYDILLSLLGVLQYNEKYPQGAPEQVPNTDANAVLFPETGKKLGGKFLAYWQGNGGLVQQGYPITDEFTEVSALDGKPYTVQYFERAVFELHPENADTKYEVLLSQLGTFRLQENNESQATPTPTMPIATSTPVQPSTTPTTVPTADIPSEVTDWLLQHSIRLRTAEPDGTDFSDMLPLKDIIGNAEIVSIGEASHGAHEFFSMKSRTFQFLVQNMGFTVIAIEGGYEEAEIANEYVHGGPGTAEEAVSGLGEFTGENKETVNLLEWMRQYNQNQKDTPEISFRGFDMQEATLPISNVVAYLQKVDIPAAENATRQYRCFTEPFSYNRGTEEQKSACRAAIGEVHDALMQKRVDYESKSSVQEFANVEHDARILEESEDYYSTSGIESSRKRDQYMAENASWILAQAGANARVMVWAHNAHVETVPYGDIMSMGQYLRQQHGDAMRVFGFDFFKGSFNAETVIDGRLGPVTLHTIPASQPGSYASYFHSARVPFMALDLRNTHPEDPASRWLIGPRKIWGIGGAFNDADPYSATGDISLLQAFDALIFVDTITPSELLP